MIHVTLEPDNLYFFYLQVDCGAYHEIGIIAAALSLGAHLYASEIEIQREPNPDIQIYIVVFFPYKICHLFLRSLHLE